MSRWEQPIVFMDNPPDPYPPITERRCSHTVTCPLCEVEYREAYLTLWSRAKAANIVLSYLSSACVEPSISATSLPRCLFDLVTPPVHIWVQRSPAALPGDLHKPAPVATDTLELFDLAYHVEQAVYQMQFSLRDIAVWSAIRTLYADVWLHKTHSELVDIAAAFRYPVQDHILGHVQKMLDLGRAHIPKYLVFDYESFGRTLLENPRQYLGRLR